MPKIGIVLTNYKNYANNYLLEFRDGLRNQDFPADSFILYIVDNASSEESRSFIKGCYPEAVLVTRNDGNYAAANNVGINKAREDGCEYFVIVNMDVMLDQNWLSSLFEAFVNSKDAGMVQSKILLYPKDDDERKMPLVNSLGNFFHFLGFGFTSAYKQKDEKIDGVPEIFGYASGCSFITSREVIDKIGMYDEEYYMYHDDLEMGWRAKLAGYKTFLAPKSIVYHKYEHSRSINMLYYMERNRYLAVLHYYSLATLFVLLPALIAMEFGMFFYSIVNGWLKTKIKIYLYFLKLSSWRKIFLKRKKLREIRMLKDKEVLQDFKGEVLFQEIDNPVLKYIANPVFNAYWQVVKKIIYW